MEDEEHTYFTQTIACFLLTSQHKEPGYQQPWYWLSLPGIFWPQYQKDQLQDNSFFTTMQETVNEIGEKK